MQTPKCDARILQQLKELEAMDDPDTEEKAQMLVIRAKLGLRGGCRVHSAAANARINRTNQPNHDSRIIACTWLRWR